MCKDVFGPGTFPAAQFSLDPEEPSLCWNDPPFSSDSPLPDSPGALAENKEDWELSNDSSPQATQLEEGVMSFEEIALALGITSREARTIYYRALKKLRARPRMLERFRLLVEYRRALREKAALRETW